MIGFNRPELLRRSLIEIHRSGVTTIFISIDGPRIGSQTDSKKVNECKIVIEEFQNKFIIMRKRFSDVNQGCKLGVKSAIDWFFENNDFGIIVEDDILISSEFVEFCAEVDSRFSSWEEIWQVNGWTPFNYKEASLVPYITRYPMIWGWATWAKKWTYYKDEIGEKSLTHPSLLLSNLNFDTPLNFDTFWVSKFQKLQRGYDTWDFQWVNTIWVHGGVAISPPLRLTQNIGFDDRATHTKSAGFRHDLKIERIDFIRSNISRNTLIDLYQGKLLYGLNLPDSFPRTNFLVRFKLNSTDGIFKRLVSSLFIPKFYDIYLTKNGFRNALLTIKIMGKIIWKKFF